MANPGRRPGLQPQKREDLLYRRGVQNGRIDLELFKAVQAGPQMPTRRQEVAGRQRRAIPGSKNLNNQFGRPQLQQIRRPLSRIDFSRRGATDGRTRAYRLVLHIPASDPIQASVRRV